MKKYTFFSFIFTISVLMLNISSYATKHVIQVGNNYFSPASVNVNVGDTMRWVWVAGTHTTTSTPGAIPAGAASWNSAITNIVTVFEYKVTLAGSYAYVCTPHASIGMVANFTATAAAPTLNVTPTNRNVTADAGNTTFTVMSNASWTVTSNATWCTATSGGNGNGTITANYTMNTSVSQRIATLTVMVTGLPAQMVTVTQAGAAPILTVTPANQNVSAALGNTSFTVVSNTAWTVSGNAGWCTFAPSGNGNGTIAITYTANTANTIRVETMTITVNGLTPQTVTVTQAASTVGLDEQAQNDFRVYPNPTKGVFKMNTGSFGTQAIDVSIMDMSGKNILSGIYSGASEYFFDLSQASRGYYFMQVKTANYTAVRRMVLID